MHKNIQPYVNLIHLKVYAIPFHMNYEVGWEVKEHNAREKSFELTKIPRKIVLTDTCHDDNKQKFFDSFL